MEEIFNIPVMRRRSEGHLAEMRRRTQTKRGWAVGQGSLWLAAEGLQTVAENCTVKRHLAHCAVQSLIKIGENCVVEVGGHLARRGKGKYEHRQDLCVEETFNIPVMRRRSEGHLSEMIL